MASSMISLFDPNRFLVNVVPATQATALQLLSCDILLLGSNDEANFAHGGFQSFRQNLGDMKLSGRLAALFSSISEISLKNLKIMLKGSEITLADDGFIVRSAWDDPKTEGILRNWVGHVVKTHDEIARI